MLKQKNLRAGVNSIKLAQRDLVKLLDLNPAAYLTVMKILQVSSATEMGGGEAHLAGLVRALATRGHSVYLAVRPNSPLRSALVETAVDWCELPLRNSLDVQSARRLAELVIREGIDIIHAHVGRDYLVAALAARRAGRARLVLTRHHYLPISKNAIYRWLLSDVSAVIAVSAAVRRSLIERLALPEERIHIIPNWVDASRFQAGDRQTVRAKYHLNSKLVVACIGQIAPFKGQEEFLRAAHRVAGMRPDSQFLIVGDEADPKAPFTRQLKQTLETLGDGRRISFTGYIEDIAELLAAVDVVVVPSWDEGFSIVTIEALAARCVVIASDVGGIRDIIKEGRTGMLVPPRDVNALANRLLWVLSDAPLRERLSDHGYRDVLARFGQEHVIDSIESLYFGLLGYPSEGK